MAENSQHRLRVRAARIEIGTKLRLRPGKTEALADVGGRLRVTSVSNGKNLGVGLLRRLGQSTASEARWSLLPSPRWVLHVPWSRRSGGGIGFPSRIASDLLICEWSAWSLPLAGFCGS